MHAPGESGLIRGDEAADALAALESPLMVLMHKVARDDAACGAHDAGGID